MTENDKNSNIDYNKWENEYTTIERIEISKNFTVGELNTLKKLGIVLVEKKYTEYEYHRIEMILYSYYEEDENGNVIQTEILKEKGVEKKEYEEILNRFSKISSYYNL